VRSIVSVKGQDRQLVSANHSINVSDQRKRIAWLTPKARPPVRPAP